MNFSQTPEQEMAVDSFIRFLDIEIKPIAIEYRDQLIPKEKMQEILQKLQPFGMSGNGVVPEEFGGFGLDAITIGLMQFELSRISPDIAITVLIQMTVAKLLVHAPSDIREKYLAPAMSAQLFGCVGMSEPDVGSDVTSIKCRAKQDGEHFIINGEKTWISSGDYSDFCLLLASVQIDDKKDLALIAVDRESGYESTNIKKMALNSQSTAQLFFADVKVPVANRMTEPKQALKTMLTLLATSRPLVSLMALGIAQAALDEAMNYAKDRAQFGKPIAGHQLIQAKIAEMATMLQAGKLLAFSALDNIDKKQRSDVSSAMSKWYGTEMACDIVNKAVQIHGGNGITKEYAVEYMYRAVRIFPFTEGTTEIQKLLIARSLLGVAAF